jgi:hypothetical protein
VFEHGLRARKEVSMRAQQAEGWTRRRFLSGLTLAGTAGFLGLSPRLVAAEPPPETTRLRLSKAVALCQAPGSVAEELLRAEEFTEIQYPSLTELETKLGAMGIVSIDEGYPVVLLGGVHTGCYELFASDRANRANTSLTPVRSEAGSTGVWGRSHNRKWLPSS